jgi:hypothetical protein
MVESQAPIPRNRALDLYGCGWCGTASIDLISAGELYCRDCLNSTTPRRWSEWCKTRAIDLELGPFLQAVKNTKEWAGYKFDSDLARRRYFGNDKREKRESVLRSFKELREEYARLRSPEAPPLIPDNFEVL